MVHIYNGILLSYEKNAFNSVVMRWMNLEQIKQSESQKEKDKYHILTNIYGIERVAGRQARGPQVEEMDCK